jgi:hypothetical protein
MVGPSLRFHSAQGIDAMDRAHRERLQRSARQSGLMTSYRKQALEFFAEKPVDPDAAPYFVSGNAIACEAFITGWHMREYDLSLRRLNRKSARRVERALKAERPRRAANAKAKR